MMSTRFWDPGPPPHQQNVDEILTFCYIFSSCFQMLTILGFWPDPPPLLPQAMIQSRGRVPMKAKYIKRKSYIKFHPNRAKRLRRGLRIYREFIGNFKGPGELLSLYRIKYVLKFTLYILSVHQSIPAGWNDVLQHF